MPGPRGRPRETVSPEVSECSRIERELAADKDGHDRVTGLVHDRDADSDPRPGAWEQHQRERHDAGGEDEARVRGRLGRGGPVPDLARHDQPADSR